MGVSSWLGGESAASVGFDPSPRRSRRAVAFVAGSKPHRCRGLAREAPAAAASAGRVRAASAPGCA